MLCKYQYKMRYRGGRKFGEYQCDVADFRQWFKKARNSLTIVIVTLQNNEQWVWSRTMYQLSFGVGIAKLRGGKRGWQKVRSATAAG